LPKKKSIKYAAQQFAVKAKASRAYVVTASRDLSDDHASRVYEGAVISLYRDFENLVLEALVGAINNDTKTISSALGVEFPKHLTDDVCRYIITGPSYFDFKGREGLIRRTKQYVPVDHYLVGILKDPTYKAWLDRLCALRNHAAHASPQSRKAVLDSIGQLRIGSVGSWLKCQGRFSAMVDCLVRLAKDIEDKAPY